MLRFSAIVKVLDRKLTDLALQIQKDKQKLSFHPPKRQFAGQTYDVWICKNFLDIFGHDLHGRDEKHTPTDEIYSPPGVKRVLLFRTSSRILDQNL